MYGRAILSYYTRESTWLNLCPLGDETLSRALSRIWHMCDGGLESLWRVDDRVPSLVCEGRRRLPFFSRVFVHTAPNVLSSNRGLERHRQNRRSPGSLPSRQLGSRVWPVVLGVVRRTASDVHDLDDAADTAIRAMSGEIASLSSVTLELDKVAPFLIKLFEIVSSPASDYLICWSEMGDSFRIIDRTKFAQVRY